MAFYSDFTISTHFYNENIIVKSKTGFVEKIDLNKLYDDVLSFVTIKNISPLIKLNCSIMTLVGIGVHGKLILHLK